MRDPVEATVTYATATEEMVCADPASKSRRSPSTVMAVRKVSVSGWEQG